MKYSLRGKISDIAVKRLNKRQARRVKSLRKTKRREARQVIKGTAKRVIVVPSPDPKVFEQAIFIVKDEYMRRPGVSQQELMRQAQRAAGSYLKSVSDPPSLASRLIPAVSAGAAALTGLGYLTLKLVGVM